MIHRNIKLPESQSFFLFGPRGSGKSTLLKQHFQHKKVLWLDLLNQRTEFELSQDPDRLLDLWKKNRAPWIVVDEVQKIPRLLDVAHRGIEEHRIRFALTGSSARKLRRGGANLLAGRAVERQLHPFSAMELKNEFDLEKALAFGLLPKLWSEDKLSGSDATDFLYAYVQTYLKEEVAAEQLVRNLDPFRRFLVSAAQSNSTIVNRSKIERDAGVSSRQVSRHFEILIDTLIGFYLEPFHLSVRKRQTAKSKFYFFDTGVVRALQNLAGETLSTGSYEFGNLFKTFLINEFVKLRAALNLKWNFSYLRTKDDVEIDLIIEKPRGKPVLIGIKSAAKVGPDDLQSLLHIKEDLDHSATYLLSNSKVGAEIENVRCLHWRSGLREIFALD